MPANPQLNSGLESPETLGYQLPQFPPTRNERRAIPVTDASSFLNKLKDILSETQKTAIGIDPTPLGMAASYSQIQSMLPVAKSLAQKYGRSSTAQRVTSVDDLTGEAALALTKAGKSYDPIKATGKFEDYAARKMKQGLIDYLRHAGMRRSGSQTLESTALSLDTPLKEFGATLGNQISDPSAPVASLEKSLDAAKMLGILTPRQQYIVKQWMEGVPASETAKELGVAQGTIQAHISQSLTKLRKIYTK